MEAKSSLDPERDFHGRPLFIPPNRESHFRDRALTRTSAKVLYAIALAESRSAKVGLTFECIKRIIDYDGERDDVGTISFLTDPNIPIKTKEQGGIPKKSVERAIAWLMQNWPIRILDKGTTTDFISSKGGHPRETFGLRTEFVAGWACGARVISLLCDQMECPSPIPYALLKEKMPSPHKRNAQDSLHKPHTLEIDIDFLVRTHYLTALNTNARIVEYTNPIDIQQVDSLRIDPRARAELPFFRLYSKYF